MTDEDRSRRQRYIESQTLSDREPVRVNELEPLLLNPIRRLYRAPFNSTIKYLEPTFVRFSILSSLMKSNVSNCREQRKQERFVGWYRSC